MDYAALRQEVARRAAGRCEYCHIPDWLATIDFELDHIIAGFHHGELKLENVAYACYSCNRYKQSNIAGRNPVTGRMVRLFNPRIDRWSQHFTWHGPSLVGKTTRGRVTIDVLRINRPERLAMRQFLIWAGSFPE